MQICQNIFFFFVQHTYFNVYYKIIGRRPHPMKLTLKYGELFNIFVKTHYIYIVSVAQNIIC